MINSTRHLQILPIKMKYIHVLEIVYNFNVFIIDFIDILAYFDDVIGMRQTEEMYEKINIRKYIVGIDWLLL